MNEIRVTNPRPEKKSKIEELANQVAQLPSAVKKLSTSKKTVVEPAVTLEERIFSYCDVHGHSAGRCQNNPHRDKKCRFCGKMGHTKATCWSKHVAKVVQCIKISANSDVGITGKQGHLDTENVCVVVETTNDELITKTKRNADGKDAEKKEEP